MTVYSNLTSDIPSIQLPKTSGLTTIMSYSQPITSTDDAQANWYAVKTRNENLSQNYLAEYCDEIYLPRHEVRIADNSARKSTRPVIPHLLLIKTSEENALRLEKTTRAAASGQVPIWIYRLPGSDRIQPISPDEFRLFRLLTTDDPTTQCEIYGKPDFHIGQKVRVTAGPFAGFTGYTRRIRSNKHVVVEIEGLCAIALPFIHPSLLQKL